MDGGDGRRFGDEGGPPGPPGEGGGGPGGGGNDRGWVPLRRFADRGRADAAALVLEALGIPHAVLVVAPVAERGPAGWVLVTVTDTAERAQRALAAHERDLADEAALRAAEAPAPDRGRTLIGLGVAIVLVAFFVVTGERDAAGGARWFRAGSALALEITHGAWWRTITALTLHADWAHVLGNAVATVVFVTAVCRWLGRGMGLFLVLATGVLGNLATAYLAGPRHNSVGASTAVFGALGLLGGLQTLRRGKVRVRDSIRGRWKRVFPIVAACLALFAMLGVSGERTDVLAHATGLGFGVLLGLGAGLLPEWSARTRLWVGGALLFGTCAAVVGAWMRAFGL